MFSKPPEFYEKLHEEAVLKAIEWQENGGNIRPVTIQETGLEDYFEKNWGNDDNNYRAEIHKWRGDGPLTVLTRISHETTKDFSYVVDTSDFVIGKPEDEFFFVQVGTCWGVLVDIEVDGSKRRVAYHMPGITESKDVSMKEMLKQLSKIGDVGSINIFYGGREYPEEEIQQVRESLDGKSLNFMNLDEKVPWGARDIMVKGESAKQYFNRGVYSDMDEEPRVERVYAGEWALK